MIFRPRRGGHRLFRGGVERRETNDNGSSFETGEAPKKTPPAQVGEAGTYPSTRGILLAQARANEVFNRRNG